MKRYYVIVLLLFGLNTVANNVYAAVDQKIVDFISENLPEYKPINDSFISDSFDNYVTFAESGDLQVSFISEGAGFRNSLGWFMVDDSYTTTTKLSDIAEYGWLYEDFSNDKLTTNDTVTVSGFEAGDRVGFFLGANGFNNDNVNIYYSVDSMNVDGNHTAQFQFDNQVAFGFEDLPISRADRDFNDAVFLVSATPPDAFGTSNIATAPVPALSQGVFGLLATLSLMTFGVRKNNA